MSIERTQIQMSTAMTAFRRTFPMFKDLNKDKKSWLHERQNEILDMYLDIEKAQHAMTLHRLRLRFLANEMWYGFGSQEFNIIHKLLEHMDIIDGNFMLSQMFCAKITSVSRNVRQILMNDPFKLKMHWLTLKPFSGCHHVSATLRRILYLDHMYFMNQVIQTKQKLHEIKHLNIDLQEVDCKKVIKEFRTMISQCHTLTSLTLRVPCPTGKNQLISLNSELFKRGMVYSASLKHLNITGSISNPPPNLWTNFRYWALHTQLESLRADVEFLQHRWLELFWTSLKSVVVDCSSFLIPEFLLSAPNIRFFRFNLSYMSYKSDSDINHEISRIEKYLEFLENFQHLERMIIHMDVVDKLGPIVKVKSAMTQILDKYLQRAKNKNLRRVQVSQAVERVSTTRFNMAGPGKSEWFYDKVVGETTRPTLV